MKVRGGKEVEMRIHMQKMKKIKYALYMMVIGAGSLLWAFPSEAGNLQESPYVEFSPDSKAFTTNAGDRDYEWYEEGVIVDTGIESSLRELKTGEHYYSYNRTGKLPIGSWRVAYKTGTCCHQCGIPAGVPYHGLTFNKTHCLASYYSGWFAYCADCGELIYPFYVYMSKEAAGTIGELDTGLDYYYLCPFCTNLEQGTGINGHYCKAISWNRYQVVYDSNSTDWVAGYMENSLHMYNNEQIYEGKQVTPVKRLSKNTYTRTGYEFQGWNTKPDGSGVSYEDQAEIYNLSGENYDEAGGGTVTLYAQWKKSESVLSVDPAGGSYKGKQGITEITGQYGVKYELKGSDLTAPSGYTVTFNTMGGQALASVKNEQCFVEWVLSQPLNGQYRSGNYYFTGASGAKDRVTASYTHQPVFLPTPVKTGSSFGGWYYDKECTKPAGKAGEKLTPSGNITLYAKWVDLLLSAENNYSVNSGKGAVDLTWTQNDGNQKAYMIYQSKDNAAWSLISNAEDIGSEKTVNRSFSYSGGAQSYTVPYTGVYQLTANGAQGNGYGSHTGGYGGRVIGKVWLEKGEKLTITIGGQAGYNGGGTGSSYGGGGGYTTISSDKKGTLLIAGGGGGATSFSNGGAGGSSTSNVSSGRNGESGSAGGGGGYLGGTAGQLIRHYDSDACYTLVDTSAVIMSNSDYLGSWAQAFRQLNYGYYFTGGYQSVTKSIWQLYGHCTGDVETKTHLELGHYFDSSGNLQAKLIPVEEGQTLNIHISSDAWGDGGLSNNSSLTVWDQNGRTIFSKTLNNITRYTDVVHYDQTSIDNFQAAFETRTGGTRGSKSAWYSFTSTAGTGPLSLAKIYWNESMVLPTGTTGIRIAAVTNYGTSLMWATATVHEISVKGSKTVKICGYEDGQVISSSPSYGGSNYVNTQYVSDYTLASGKQAGNGSVAVSSVKVGYQEIQTMKGVAAPDLAAPDAVQKTTFVKSAQDENTLSLSWKPPADQGTAYYHRAESYLTGKTAVISNSNVTKNVLVTGIKGYYWLADQNASTTVNGGNGKWTASASAQITLTADKQYFHVAAVDKAGNISATVHLEIGRADREVAWPIWTDQLKIASNEGSVYLSGTDRTYYVKCDGRTPFTISSTAWITGKASSSYQINHMQLHMEMAGTDKVVMDIETPVEGTIKSTAVTYQAAELIKTLTGKSLLGEDSYAFARRREDCRYLDLDQRFVMDTSMNDRKLRLTPVAGADFEGEMVTSEWSLDQLHSIWLIGDGVAPDITGTEKIKKLIDIEPVDGERILTFEAADTGSGLKEFYVIINNGDNGGRRKFLVENGQLEIVIKDDDTLFQGDFTAEFHAIDQVGNESIITCIGESFALTAYVERILEPHKPIFRCGESGMLDITSYGYADRVEVIFPKELSDIDPQLDMKFTYDGTVYRQEEQYAFMVPLETPLGEYQITVKAWKDGKLKTAVPVIWTLGPDESVLDDLRTRLR